MLSYYEIDEACEECKQDCNKCRAREECDNCPLDYEDILNGLDEW